MTLHTTILATSGALALLASGVTAELRGLTLSWDDLNTASGKDIGICNSPGSCSTRLSDVGDPIESWCDGSNPFQVYWCVGQKGETGTSCGSCEDLASGECPGGHFPVKGDGAVSVDQEDIGADNAAVEFAHDGASALMLYQAVILKGSAPPKDRFLSACCSLSPEMAVPHAFFLSASQTCVIIVPEKRPLQICQICDESLGDHGGETEMVAAGYAGLIA